MTGKLKVLLEAEYERFYSLAFRMTGNHHDTQDVLQNSFIKAFENIDKFRGSSKLSTWIYRIIINESKRFFSKINALPITCITKREGITEEAFFERLKTLPSFDDELIVDEMREKCLQGFLKCMPQKHRAAFLLKTVSKLSINEISLVLDISPDNTKVSIHRARQKMKEMLDERCSLIDPKKPCDCYLWVRYARERGIDIPKVSFQEKNKDLKKEHFMKLGRLMKISYLYEVSPEKDKTELLKRIKNFAHSL